MARSSWEFEKRLARLRRWLAKRTGSQVRAELPPLRLQLLSLDHLIRHARTLHAEHRVDRRARDNVLLARLEDSDLVLDDAHAVLSASVGQQNRLTPAGEWLLDNFYLLKEQVVLVGRHLPRSYNRQLPWLSDGPHRNLPRVYALAVELITHVDGRFDEASANGFIAAYQEGSALSLGELWAFPIMLRMALIEVVRRVAERVALARSERDQAGIWAERFRVTAEQDPTDLVMVLADLARSDLVRSERGLSDAFIAEFTRRIHAVGQAQAMVGDWLEQRLAPRGGSITRSISVDSQAQAAYQMSISNAIGSLRDLSTTDWREFVEHQSVVERILLDDPAGCYGRMDFATRDRYRHQVETIARRSRQREPDIASLVVRLARAPDSAGRTRHVGWWLVDAGRRALWRRAGTTRTFGDLLLDLLLAIPLTWYLGSAVVLSVGCGFAAHALLAAADPGSAVRLLLAGLTAAVALGPALACMDALVTAIIPPRPLGRLDLSEALGADQRTAVAVPVLLTSTDEIDALVGRLEVRHLANRDPGLLFVLLSDLADAATAELAQDQPLVVHAARAIDALNQRHRRGDGDGPFLLLHRARQHNPGEDRWMGRERKRGKLEDLNAAIQHGVVAPFSRIAGAVALLEGVRYVIVLDADTQLPHGAAAALVGAIAHPLNAPLFDPAVGRVVAGHGLIQPRVGSALPTSRRSWLARLSSGDAGIDPYTRTVSDVYQDLFAEGSFVGKGIYEVAVFDQVLTGRFPDNRILSHDLIEGCHLRSALDSQTVVYEDQPARLLADRLRRHRWTRGDWQIARWLLPAPPAAQGQVANPLSPLSRWKIFDNLRRSLAPGLWVVLLASISLLPEGGVAFAGVLILLALPVLLPWLSGAAQPAAHQGLRSHLHQLMQGGARSAAAWLIDLALLPFAAINQLDAIARSLWRMQVSHTRLLEWTTASEAERLARSDLPGCVRALGSALLLTLLIGAGACWTNPQGAAWYGPLLALWLLAPAVVALVSRPLGDGHGSMSDATRTGLRRLALRTWRFFAVQVGDHSRWLPPDNVQEKAQGQVIAQRTSPTNIGLALLANLGARDFALLTLSGLVERCRKTLDTMDRLERFHGHLYNWYDTVTLEPLPPRYVSTVDSGNLMGHLLVLGGGLDELAGQPIIPRTLGDTLVDLVAIAIATDQPDREDDRRLLALAREAQGAAGDLFALRDPLARLGAEVRARNQTTPDEWLIAIAELASQFDQEIAAVAPWTGLGGADDAAIAELPPALRELRRGMPTFGRIIEAAAVVAALPPPPGHDGQPGSAWSRRFAAAVTAGANHARDLLSAADEVARRCRVYARPELDFLYDERRKLFAVGYQVRERRRDSAYYDLLASEARLTSYIAVATGAVDPDHWFALSRTVTEVAGRPCLVSWSGSMFEYLMPMLVMPSCAGTLLDSTSRAAVAAQIAYGNARGVPWGISESGYLRTDQAGNFQYRAFGVPGLGLKRGLDEDLVVAPYATVMAAMVDPDGAVRNLQRLARSGAGGEHGYVEAIDYTPARLPPGESQAVVRQYMVHHQGMALLALVQVLLDRPMQRRFLADPELRAAELLLHERVPGIGEPLRPDPDPAQRPAGEPGDPGGMRVLGDPCPGVPEVHLLSNGRYHVMVTAGGSGYSRCGELALTRWHQDPTIEAHGFFCYLRDADSPGWWSVAHQPGRNPTRRGVAVFTLAKAEFHRRDFGIDAQVEIAVSSDDDVEVRRMHLTNVSRRTRTIELTTFAEVVIAPLRADETHPAFSNLFVRTEPIDDGSAMLATRRPRGPDEHPPWLLHLVQVHGTTAGAISSTSDRLAFVGRGRTPADPQAMRLRGPLGGETGHVLDPVLAIRRSVVIAPDETVVVDIVLGLCADRSAAVAMVDKHRDRRIVERVFASAWSHANIALARLGISPGEAQLFGRLAGAVLLPTGHRRAPSSLIARNRRGQAGLWSLGISGDLPIVVLHCADPQHLELARGLVQAHAWWASRGVASDLVLLVEHPSSYRQELRDALAAMVASGPAAATIDRPTGVFIRRSDQMSEEDRVLLLGAAVAVFHDGAGTLEEQSERLGRLKLPTAEVETPPLDRQPAGRERHRPDLILGNGLGGFTGDGREYVTLLPPGTTTPAPWCNVIANPHFGTLVSESGGGYTWLENSHEFRLTPWYNEAVGDRSGQALYLRDDDTGESWSPTPGPRRGAGTYEIRHGFGYSVFEHEAGELASELTVYVAIDAPVCFQVLRLRNTSRRARRVSLLGCFELVLGEQRGRSHLHVVSDLHGPTGVLTARNSFHPDLPERIAFLDVQAAERTYSADRHEFIGAGRDLADPAALGRAALSGCTGGGLDPCFSFMVPLTLEPGESYEQVILLGAARDQEDLLALTRRFRRTGGAHHALEAVWERWKQATGAIQVTTPDPAFDVLMNGWMVYQVLSARMWGRTGYYQSGGAYGFRDQLQDVMALVHAEPAIVRAHLLTAACHQFRDGDVQHWWHPPSGRGVRTRCSDDLLWLPLAVARYIEVTGDRGVLDESRHFIEGRAVAEGEEAYYDLPQPSSENATLYVHCVRALHRSLRMGGHGLPLMGGGDWNDGMNLVGIAGAGESVWLGCFLHDVLRRFEPLASARDDHDTATTCRTEALRLRKALESQAWDGEWYLRAWFDDGRALGSRTSLECRIDALPQSWAVLGGAGDRSRCRSAMEAVDRHLVRRDEGLIALFDPPFDQSDLEPGYLKGYPPGVRENGGQYTHAAVWTAMAFAALGDRDRAWACFDLLNPVHHGDSPEAIARYRVEPYVLAADVYAVAPHGGRGGWTWYTGSAGWFYRLAIESLLGLERIGPHLRLTPLPRPGWTGYRIAYRHGSATYHITVEGDGAVQEIRLDDRRLDDGLVPLADDGRDHQVLVRLGG